jgi:uncharacterized coiled-coil protein SlyX
MTYTSEEIKDLLLYVAQTQKENEDLRAQLMALMAKLNNEEAKVRILTIQLKAYTR